MLKRIRAAREDGFTLTELLIVIVVLGILAGIVVFAVQNFTQDSVKSACEADKRTVMTAAEAYRAKSASGTYPATINDLQPNFLREIPTNPQYVITIVGGVVTVTAPGGGPGPCS